MGTNLDTLRRVVPLFVPLIAMAGCADETAPSAAFVVATAVSVDPQAFLGSVSCAKSPGAMRSYVATVTDRTDPDGGFVLPSSPAVSCSQQVSFRYVVPGHTYTAEVDAYEELPEDLVPFGGSSTGSRRMLRRDSGEPVTPRWTSSCGEGPSGAATAAEHVNAIVTGCSPLVDSSTEAGTAIVVDPARALGSLQCDDLPRFDVVPNDPSLPPVFDIACSDDEPEVATYEDGIVPGTLYTFSVRAADEEGTSYRAECEAIAVPGLTTEASCLLLSARGAMDVPLASLFADAGGECVAKVEIIDPEPHSSIAPVGCSETVRFAPLDPGTYEVGVTRLDGMASAAGTCTATVRAGETASATCVPP